MNRYIKQQWRKVNKKREGKNETKKQQLIMLSSRSNQPFQREMNTPVIMNTKNHGNWRLQRPNILFLDKRRQQKNEKKCKRGHAMWNIEKRSRNAITENSQSAHTSISEWNVGFRCSLNNTTNAIDEKCMPLIASNSITPVDAQRAAEQQQQTEMDLGEKRFVLHSLIDWNYRENSRRWSSSIMATGSQWNVEQERVEGSKKETENRKYANLESCQ